jgi:pimeloyl-ACP methyl ester carboxylesterase
MITNPLTTLPALLLLGALAFARGTPSDALDKAPSRFVKVDDIKVHYKSLGEGKKALVLIHGWSCDLTYWSAQVPALEGKVRLLLIDLPGHGKSDRPKVKYTMDVFARATDAVMKDAGVGEAVLAGHSMGTPVARQYYRLFPKKTAGLIAVDGSFRPFTTDKEEIEKFVSVFEGPKFKETVLKFVDGMFPPKADPALRDRVKAKMASATQHVAVSAMREMMDPALWKDDRIDVPVQVILAKSKFWAEDYEAFVRKLAPKVDYRTMDGVGHFLHMERPEEFNRILIAFLKQQGYWSAPKN